MRVLIQRVTEASVRIDDRVVGRIGTGLLLLTGIRVTDTPDQVDWMVRKVTDLRIFEDENGKFNRSLREIRGELLVVSQFTLYGNARKGRRPSFSHAAPPETAQPLCDLFCEKLRKQGFKVEEGEFAARMEVSLVNDGPVTLLLENEAKMV